MASDNQVLNTDGLNQDNRAFFSALVLVLHLKSMCYSLIYIVAWHGVKTRVHFQVLTQYKHVYISLFAKCCFKPVGIDLYRAQLMTEQALTEN